MTPNQRYWYLDEIVNQAIAASVAFSEIERRVQDPQTRQTLLVWTSISSFLAHAGVVSKILFPSGSQTRANELKQTIQIESLPNLMCRAGRDNIEHIDERIDFWASVDRGKMVTMVFDDRKGLERLCDDQTAVRRALIADEMVYVSEGRRGERAETSLVALRDELEGVKDASVRAMSVDPPYHFVFATALDAYRR